MSEYVPEEGGVFRFLMACNAASVAWDALKEHPTTWKPGGKEMARMLYRRELACEGLGIFEGGERGTKDVWAESETILELEMKVAKVRHLTKVVI